MNKFAIKYKNKIALWFVPAEASFKPISSKELKWQKKLTSRRSKQYEHSRGYVREVLSHILVISPLEIRIISPPRLHPELSSEMGYVSFRHFRDGLLIGWSTHNIGLEIERSNRFFEAKRIVFKFVSSNERQLIKVLKGEQLNAEVLKLWLRKEAAIKEQRGSIFSDISKWIVKSGSNKIENQINGYKLRSHLINHANCYISIASDINSLTETPIICSYY